MNNRTLSQRVERVSGMRFEQQLHMQQQLKLNTKAIQSLEVLQLPLVELETFLVEAFYENPFLEMEEAGHGQPPESETRPPVVRLHREERTGGTQTEAREPTSGALESFTDILDEQITAMKLEKDFAALCKYLIRCLDQRGYFSDDLYGLTESLSISEFDLNQAVYFIQSLEPTGVGARSLQECLVLQLAQSQHLCSETLKTVNEGLDLLARNRISDLARLLNTTHSRAEEVAGIIKSLNPIPSQGYYTGEEIQIAVPDAVVTLDEERRLCITINSGYYPKLTLNEAYGGLAKEAPEAREYLRTKKAEAESLIYAIERREQTLAKIMGWLCMEQDQFLLHGKGLRPLTLSDVASKLDLNPSTISRAIKGKYLVCPAGTFPLKALFSGGFETKQGTSVSTATIEQEIKQLVNAEMKTSPLSDEDITGALVAKGIEISRRTVAKYRERLGIPSSRGRRSGI